MDSHVRAYHNLKQSLPVCSLTISSKVMTDRLLALSDRKLCNSEPRVCDTEHLRKTLCFLAAHTPLSFHELCETLRDLGGSDAPSKVLFIVAMSKDKDHRQCLQKLHGSGLNLRTPIFTEVPVAGGFERATPADALSECWSEITKGGPPSVPDVCQTMSTRSPRWVPSLVLL